MTSPLPHGLAWLPRSLRRFIVTGLAAVAVDGATYALLLKLGLLPSPAKGFSFIAGAAFAYFANRLWAFDDAEKRRGEIVFFCLVYGMSILVNISINHGVLRLGGEDTWAYPAGWFLATGASATLNYLGLRFLVFRKARN